MRSLESVQWNVKTLWEEEEEGFSQPCLFSETSGSNEPGGAALAFTGFVTSLQASQNVNSELYFAKSWDLCEVENSSHAQTPISPQ